MIRGIEETKFSRARSYLLCSTNLFRLLNSCTEAQLFSKKNDGKVYYSLPPTIDIVSYLTGTSS